MNQPPAALRLHVECPRLVAAECPYCDAAAGESCRDRDGQLQLANHHSRVEVLLKMMGRR